MNDEEKELIDRYQFQPWYIKLWRFRYKTLIWYYTIKPWLLNKFIKSYSSELSFYHYYQIARGMADYKMKYYYTWEEVQERLNIKGEDNVKKSSKEKCGGSSD